MNEYSVTTRLCTTTFKRYSKKYTTPPVFQFYKFNLLLCIISILTGGFLTLMSIVYKYVFVVDVLLAATYLFTNVVIRAGYCNGIFNKSVYYQSKLYRWASICAFVTQSALYRIFIPVASIIFGNENFKIDGGIFAVSCIVGIVLSIVSIASVFGTGSKNRFNTKTSQKVYSAILDGPNSFNESASVLMQNTLDFSILKLENPELANIDFFRAHDKFMKSAEEIQKITANYDDQWRKSLFYSSYETSDTFNQSPLAKRFTELLEEHRQNAYALNKIIAELNTIDVVKQIAIIPAKNKKTLPTVSKKNISNHNIVYPKKPKEELWDNVANWYN